MGPVATENLGVVKMVRQSLIWLVLASLVVFSSPGQGDLCFAQDETEADEEELQSPLAEEPETVEEYFDAVLLMLRLSRPELAARYLNGLMQLDPDDEALLELRQKHGTGTFLELGRFEELQPLADQLVGRLTEASLAVINDPGYVEDLMTKLSGSAREKAEAVNELKQLGPHACMPLLQQLNAQDSSVDRDLIMYTLIELGEPAVSPLLGALRRPGDQLRAHVLEILGFIGRKENVLPHLWSPAFAEGEPNAVRTAARIAIARILYGDAEKVTRIPSFGIPSRVETAALEHFRGNVTWETGEDDRVDVWTWDEAAGTVREHRVTPVSASLFTGRRFAGDLLKLTPGDEDAQALFLALTLATERYRAGWDQPLSAGPGTAHDLALLAGENAVERTLRLALKEDNVAAAEAALVVLGKNGTRHLLSNRDGEGSAILDALNSPHERIQFQAASTIMQLDPQKPFRGAARVVEVFARTLNGTPQPRTVVIDPNVDRANHVAALVGSLGYDSDVAVTGMEGFRQIAAHGDTELAILHLNTIRWELSQTVTNLRADARTAGVPIAIYGPQGLQGRVQHLIRDHQPVVYLAEANNPSDVARTIRPFLARISPPALTDQQRAQQISAAAYWLRHIGQGRRTDVFDLTPAEDALAEAVSDERVARDALIALAAIGSASSQQRLADAALAPGYAVEVRETAALQLAFHIQQFGVLLKNGQLTSLQSAWESAAEPVLKTALSSVIGSLGPQQEAVTRQLQNFQGDATPVE